MKLIKNTVLKIVLSALMFSAVLSVKANELGDETNPIPIVSIQPNYPIKALTAGIEGWVQLEFIITKQGSVIDEKIIDSFPENIFDSVALRAMSKFKFKPKMIKGKVVESIARQKIEFLLPGSESFKAFTSEQILKFNEKISSNTINNDWFILADTVKLKSSIKAKSIKKQNIFFDDVMFELNLKPYSWEGEPVLSEEDIDSYSIDTIIQIVKDQYKNNAGLYKKYHTIYSAKSHPPVLISAVDDVKFTSKLKTEKLKFKVNLNKFGNIIKITGKDRESKYFLMFDFEGKFQKSLKFMPAIKNNKPVGTPITLEFKVAKFDRLSLLSHHVVNNKHINSSQPWVKLALLINDKGSVEESKVISSSNPQFEKIAQNKIKLQRFKSNSDDSQLITLVEFTLPN